MKKTTIISAIVLAMVLVIGLSFASFAAADGSITITDTSEAQVYNAYLMAELVSVSGDNYSYKIVPQWENFFAMEGIAFDPVTKYITYNGNITDLADFASKAVAYAQDPANGISVTKTATVGAGQTSVKMEGLTLGYYCIDSTVGTVCALTTTNTDASLAEKNPPPTINKTVKEDSSNQYGPQNDESVGKDVYFRITVTKRAGAINYVITDTMSAGLTFNPSSVDLYYYDPGENKVALDKSGLKYDATLPAKYSSKTFVIELLNSEIQALADGTKIICEYTATVNENAVIGSAGNPNEATIVYGRDPYIESEPVKTITYVWDFGVFKYEVKDGANKGLAGATFSFLTKAGGSEIIHAFDYLGKVGGVDTYRYNPAGSVTQFTTDSTGLFKIVGIDSGDFWLREISAPAGYNKITYDIEVDLIITGVYTDASTPINLSVKGANTDGNIEVLNSTGVVLPETGGEGTAAFIAIGSTLVIAMGVLLIVKKRMTKVVYTR